MSARIWAPPRLFFVDTPSAVAADMGCAYTLDVDDSGGSLLRVTSGWVALQLRDRESIVPAGAACQTRSGIGPGTPYFEDADADFRRALTELDFGTDAAAKDSRFNVLLQKARVKDTLTLWHLIARLDGDDRRQRLREDGQPCSPARRSYARGRTETRSDDARNVERQTRARLDQQSIPQIRITRFVEIRQTDLRAQNCRENRRSQCWLKESVLNRRSFIQYASAALVLPVVGLGAVQLACADKSLLAKATGDNRCIRSVEHSYRCGRRARAAPDCLREPFLRLMVAPRWKVSL